MIIQPKVRGFVCITAHPEGCAAHIDEQIAHVRAGGPIKDGPKKVLILGASTGYGLATRIATAFGSGAATLGVFFERPSSNGKPASAGWYNTAAFEKKAHAEGLYAKSLNGDAFSPEMKQSVVDFIRRDLGQVDLVVYSLASPRRIDPATGEVHKSVLKPIGGSYKSKNLDTDKKLVLPVEIGPAEDAEIASTVKVMGGEDWLLWMEALENASLLSDGCSSMAYDYIGPELTWPVYTNGTIGAAKKHLRETAARIDAMLKVHRGRAFVSVNKAVVTQASSAIPVVPLYISLLFKVMKEKGLHEDCIQQIDRLLRTQMYNDGALNFDDLGRVRIDDWEMRQDVQAAVAAIWPEVESGNIDELTDFTGYQKNFLKLFGFGLPGVDYERETEPEVDIPSLAETSSA